MFPVPDDTGVEGIVGLHGNKAPAPHSDLEDALVETVVPAGGITNEVLFLIF
jgi:hypothetical protein